MTDFKIGQIITTKKSHPCGGNQWEILRVGADFRLKCTKCGHQIMMRTINDIIQHFITGDSGCGGSCATCGGCH